MADRVPSDHPSVTAVRAGVERSGATRRPELRVPADAADRFPEGVVRLVVDGSERHAPVVRREDGSLALRGAFDTPPMARDRTGPDRLAEWIDAEGPGFGRSVLIDVVVPEFRYGLRRPGERAVYDASEPPSRSLRGIAEGLGGE